MKSDEREAKEIYEKYGEYYERMVLEDPERQNLSKILYSMVGNTKGKLILDLGCGVGFDAEHFARNGAKVVAVDFSEKMLDIAKKRCEGLDVEFQLNEIDNIESKERFDMALMAFTIMYKKDFQETLKRIHEMLKPGASVFIVISHPIRKMIKYTKNYFTTGKHYEQHGDMEYFNYFRTMEEYVNSITSTGFIIDQIKEPKPITENSEENYFPHFLIFKLKRKI